jgi:hypothetical protein
MARAAWTPAATARRRALAVTSLTLLLAAVLLVFTLQGRAFANEVLHFFTRAGSDTLPYTPELVVWVDLTPGVPAPTMTPLPAMAPFAADCGDYPSARCSIEQIRSKVDFTISELGTIPTGFYFIGATGGPDRVWILYDNGNYGYGLAIVEEPWTGNSELTQWKIGASAVVEPVQIGSVTGEYVKGAFVLTADGSNEVWDVNAGEQTLHWVDHGVFFSMEEWGPAAILDQAGFVVLAESLTTEPVSARLTPVPATETPAPVITYNGEPYNLSVSQAEEQAGFDVLEPKRLPEILSFAGASYEPEQNIVRIFYIEQQPVLPHTFGLTVSEELAPNTADCKLCSMVIGDYGDFLTVKSSMVVGASAVVETVQVGGFTGQYVEGQWGQSNSGWAWLPYPEIKTLRWQAHGMAFELQYSGFSINNEVPISKTDLIAIAENMMK